MRKKQFAERALSIVRKIPEGKVMTYGDVAFASGYPGAARAVGTLMAGNHDTSVPCHRVVRADGSIGEYNGGGTDMKRKRLSSEGVLLRGTKIDRGFFLTGARI